MFVIPDHIFCPDDPTLTPTRKQEYRDYYNIKYEICKRVNPTAIVEIGVRAGYSAYTFLSACPNASYIGLDANNGQHGGRGGEDGKFSRWAEKILNENGFIFELHWMDTQTIDHLPLFGVDLFHVDGDHTKDGVKHDLKLAYETLFDDGYILVDDVKYILDVQNGVKEWVEEMGDKIEWQYIESLRGEVLIRKVK